MAQTRTLGEIELEQRRRIRQHLRSDGTPKQALSKQEAEIVAMWSDRPQEAYRCPRCGKWHTGHVG